MVVQESVKGDGIHPLSHIYHSPYSYLAGGLCGAILLDQGFLQLIKKLTPRSIWDKLGPRGVDRLLALEWENGIKVTFGAPVQKYEIQLPFGGTAEDGFHPPELMINT